MRRRRRSLSRRMLYLILIYSQVGYFDRASGAYVPTNRPASAA